MKEALTYADVSLVPYYTDAPSRKDVDTVTKLGRYSFSTPIVSANMDTITGPRMAIEMARLGGLGILHRFCTIEESVEMYKEAAEGCKQYAAPVGISIGVIGDAHARAEALVEAGAEMICVDVAHGYSKLTGLMVKHLKEQYPEVFVIAGNVATLSGADYLSSCGADCVKVGIGNGGHCTTRMKTGCGVPQLTAVMECSRVKVPIIADGGITCPGDFVKSLVAGGAMAMMGGQLAATLETPGEVERIAKKATAKPDNPDDWHWVKVYRGMASKEAQEDFIGQIGDWKTAEGVSSKVPCKGPVEDVVRDMMGGLRSAMTYCGSQSLAVLRQRAEFIRVTNAGYREGTAHGTR